MKGGSHTVLYIHTRSTSIQQLRILTPNLHFCIASSALNMNTFGNFSQANTQYFILTANSAILVFIKDSNNVLSGRGISRVRYQFPQYASQSYRINTHCFPIPILDLLSSSTHHGYNLEDHDQKWSGPFLLSITEPYHLLSSIT